MKDFNRLVALAVLAAGLPSVVGAAYTIPRFRLNQYYDSNAVLQRGRALPVSGTAEQGRTITVTFAGTTLTTTASLESPYASDNEARWRVQFPAQLAGGPYVLTASDGTTTLTATNVMVGDVFLVSGQSNAYYPVERFASAAEWLKDADYPNVRFIEATENHFAWQLNQNAWKVASSQTAGKCSAMGFFFAKELQRHVDATIGVVTAAWDGSLIAEWLPDCTSAKDHYTKMLNNDLEPLPPFPVRAVLWYQGESDGMFGFGYDYRFKLQKLVRNWRTIWNDSDLPFVVVQLPYYGAYGQWCDVRDSQNWTATQEQKVWVVPTLDIGDMNDIHPPKKPELGVKLSDYVRKYVYGETGLHPEGPVYRSHEIKGNEIFVSFDVATSIASSDGQSLKGFTVGGDYYGQTKFFDGSVRIVDAKTVAVSASQFANPLAVRYGFSNCSTVNFFDSEGHPAGAFRTDDFRLQSQPESSDEPSDEPSDDPAGDSPVVPAGVIAASGDLTGATDTTAIQSALDAAKSSKGTVTLGSGTFYLNAQLLVAGGVTLEGQGREKTVICQSVSTASKDTRVASVSGGSVLRKVALTGGRISTTANNMFGGGVLISDGTVSWCTITNNSVVCGNTAYGGGVAFASGKGRLDHSVVADNFVRSTTEDICVGGGIGVYLPYGAITIEACLVRGNRASNTTKHYTGRGGGIGIEFSGFYNAVTVRNTTIVGNSVGEDRGVADVSEGGAVYSGGDSNKKLKMVNCINAFNATVNATTDVKLSYAGGVSNCLFDKAADLALVGGTDCKSGDPKFSNAPGGDYSLAANSPAKGAGVTYADIGTDLFGNDFSNPPSMGCCEFGSSAPGQDPTEPAVGKPGVAFYVD